MATILDEIAAFTRSRVAAEQAQVPLEEMRQRALELSKENSAEERFLQALRRPGISFICEVKKASPSRGVISPDFPYLEIAGAYEKAGADAISCLTEPHWFQGSDGIFRDIRSAVRTPMLRKDFTVDEYQIWQARVLGADAVLLICSLLDTATLEQYLGICRELGLSALVEAHSEEEIGSAVAAGSAIIGVNNRNLRDFSVDFGNVARLRSRIPPEVVCVAESGVQGPEDVAQLKAAGVDAVLIGETLMRAADRGAMLHALREAAT